MLLVQSMQAWLAWLIGEEMHMVAFYPTKFTVLNPADILGTVSDNNGADRTRDLAWAQRPYKARIASPSAETVLRNL
jgi:hypothetical protein